MKIKIIDMNRGQVPKTIKKAVSLTPYSRKDIEKCIIENGCLIVINNGYYFKFKKK